MSAISPTFINGEVSFWYRDLGLPSLRPGLPGDVTCDVCIVGAGFTGLWTAYYLKRAQPDLRIVVLDREFAGFGASGRNGGWLTAALPGDAARYAKTHGRDAVITMQKRMMGAVDEVINVARNEGIEADIVKGGVLEVATSEAQRQRLVEHVEGQRRYGWDADDLMVLSLEELDARLRVRGARAGAWSPHCARIHPATLVRGLAAAVERLGVTIYEGTEVTEIRPRQARTRLGTVRADYIIRATEGFTAGLKGERRTWLPMNSSMIATEPLPAGVWDQIGWAGRELLGDAAHSYIYAQRTADDRIAIGGRGVPYRFGSKWDRRGRTQQVTVAALRRMLVQLFPAAAEARIDHAWSGVLGVPRDWCATVGLNPRTGLGWAGGYVGHGVTTTNLAGRTLRDLILGRETELVTLPWVGRRVRSWEAEPLRWLGVRSMYVAYRAADRRENAGLGHTSAIARVANRITGR